MSGTHPTLRHGLPYGWWKRADFWGGLLAFVSGVGALVLFTVIVLAWWGFLP